MASTETHGTTEGVAAWLHAWQDGPHRPALQAPLYTIADVSKACGLPGPVIMQLVDRTWTPLGWLYTEEQRNSAVTLAADLRRRRAEQPAALSPLTGRREPGCS